MTIDTITASSASSAPPKATLTADFNMFLKLLTTQLQYQDPLDPMDTSQYTQQLVSYSQVEQAIQQTARLDQILAKLGGDDLGLATGYIGKSVTAWSPSANLGETGGADWMYRLAGDSSVTTLRIVDANNRTVRTLTGATGAGDHRLQWDGMKSDGTRAAPGTYALVAAAADADGNLIEPRTGVAGTVAAVESSNGELLLSLGGTRVRVTDISTVSAAQ